MTFARRVFTAAGAYGLLALIPQYFLEGRNGRDWPPEITHPEYYYGFVGVALAWQIAFFVIADDPIRYRLVMIPAAVEKLAFGIAVAVLFWMDRANPAIFGAALVDVLFAVLFAVAFVRSSRSDRAENRRSQDSQTQTM
ncbi:MAG: hypothetical protein IT175_13180 [Acidobacteria bacterium]|nr:hypothetical protein [Acidobacteriota bacterium]